MSQVVNNLPSSIPVACKYITSNNYISNNGKYLDTIVEPNDEHKQLFRSGPIVTKTKINAK